MPGAWFSHPPMLQSPEVMLLQRTLALSALAAVCCTAVAQDPAVSPKEIQETWVGKELIGTTPSGSRVTMSLEASGKASVAVGSTFDRGTWRLSEHGYCTTWSTLRNGKEACFTVTRQGSTFTVLNTDGSVSGYFSSIK